MKVNIQMVANISLMFAVTVVLVASAGCFYPKAERAPGELVSDVDYEIINEIFIDLISTWSLAIYNVSFEAESNFFIS